MSLNITSPLTDQLIAALCDTLVYSLLQGIVLAAIAGLIIVFTRNASAARRYNMLVGVLVLFAIGSVATFVVQMQHVAAPVVQAINVPANNNNAIQIIDNGPVVSESGKTDILATISGYLNSHHNAIVLIWFMVICVRCIQLATGLQGIYLLKKNKVFAVAAEWEQWLQQMSNKLGIKQKVALLESGLAKVPMVVGHLKPVILIPVGLFTALSTDQVEAILMHELAHIRRRDYLVNLLQNLVEIVFFFNPAVLWVSQLIKTEREHCCDDMALAQNAGKASYIRALVSCEEYQQSVPAYAMAFPGQKNHLVDRVKRMMTNRNHSLDTVEKTLLTICLVAAGLFTTAFTHAQQIDKMVKTTKKALSHATETIAKEINPGKEDTLAKETPKAEAATPETSATVAPADTDIRKKEPLAALSGNLGKLQGSLGPINYNVNTNTSDSVSNRRTLPVSPKPHAVAPAVTPVPRVQYNSPYNSTYPANAYKPDTGNYLKEQNKYKAREKKYTDDREAAIDDMIKDGLIKSRDNLSFMMSNKEFIINYKKQPDDVFQKYKAKYVKTSGHGDWSWMYNYDTEKHTESSTTIDNTSEKSTDTVRKVRPGVNTRLAMPGRLNSTGYIALVIADLKADGIIAKDAAQKDVSFKIDNNALIVNGKKQPESLFNKYNKKYIRSTIATSSLTWNMDTGSFGN